MKLKGVDDAPFEPAADALLDALCVCQESVFQARYLTLVVVPRDEVFSPDMVGLPGLANPQAEGGRRAQPRLLNLVSIGNGSNHTKSIGCAWVWATPMDPESVDAITNIK